MEWLAKQCEKSFKRALATTRPEVNILACDKRKRKIIESAEAKQSYSLRAYPLVKKEALSIEAKRQQCERRSK